MAQQGFVTRRNQRHEENRLDNEGETDEHQQDVRELEGVEPTHSRRDREKERVLGQTKTSQAPLRPSSNQEFTQQQVESGWLGHWKDGTEARCLPNTRGEVGHLGSHEDDEGNES